jgi:molybdate/tungstate transport system permease protein
MRFTKTEIIVLLGVLLAAHVAFAFMPSIPFSSSTNLVLFFVNVFVLISAGYVVDFSNWKKIGAFFLGYLLLFGSLILVANKPPLFVLLAVLYVGFYGTRKLLGFFVIFASSFVLLQPFAFESFIVLFLLYWVYWRLEASASAFGRRTLMFGLVGLALVLLPMLHLVMQDSIQSLLKTLERSDVRQAILTSITTSTLSTAILIVWGVPFSYGMARHDFPGKKVIETLIDIPILIPQSVAGIAFIVMLGPGSILGGIFEGVGVSISGTYVGIVIAQVFVSSPFIIKSSIAAFESVPVRYEKAARTLGAGEGRAFLLVTLPLASRGVLIGAALSWARAISEFGCIVLFASSPATAPVLVHTEFLRAGASESRPLAVLFLIICLWVFLLLHSGRFLLPYSLQMKKKEQVS